MNSTFIDKQIYNICQNDYNYFLKKNNVIGIGLGYKVTSGVCIYKKCIKVYVIKKICRNKIFKKDFIPLIYKNILTDVVESGPIKLQGLKERIRPVLGGYSISNLIFKKSGTMACLVTDSIDNYILSCNHILATINKMPIGTIIVQPGAQDGGKYSKDDIGTLSKFIPLLPNKEGKPCENIVDCAMAKVISPDLVSSKIALIGGIKGVHLSTIGECVKKAGRTTGLTTGKVHSIGATFKTTIFSKIYIFKDQIVTTKMSDGGDSGSLLLDSQNYALGLLYSGTKSYSVFNPIRAVIGSLGVTIVTS